jgi:hypothetical protein
VSTSTATRRTAAARPRTTRVAPGSEALGRLPGADYADAFRIASDVHAPAAAWARHAFEGGSPTARRVFRVLVWQGLLGMRLAAEGRPGHLAGWFVAEDEPDVLEMQVRSWMFAGRLVTETTPEHTTITTMLRFDRRVGRLVWNGAGRLHRRMMPGVLGRAASGVARESRGRGGDAA